MTSEGGYSLHQLMKLDMLSEGPSPQPNLSMPTTASLNKATYNIT